MIAQRRRGRAAYLSLHNPFPVPDLITREEYHRDQIITQARVELATRFTSQRYQKVTLADLFSNS